MPQFDFHLTMTRRVWPLAALALFTMALGTVVALYRFDSARQIENLRRECAT